MYTIGNIETAYSFNASITPQSEARVIEEEGGESLVRRVRRGLYARVFNAGTLFLLLKYSLLVPAFFIIKLIWWRIKSIPKLILFFPFGLIILAVEWRFYDRIYGQYAEEHVLAFGAFLEGMIVPLF
jgi:hypothetical protein